MTSQPGDVLVHTGAAGYATNIEVGAHSLMADEPPELGGTDLGPNPYDFLVAALASCTSMTLRMYADRKGWPLESITVRARHHKIHAQDCLDCETKEGRGVNRGLEQANVRLTDYSHTLESRVVERTRELSEQNAKLEEVLAELRRTQNQMVLQEKMASLGSLVAGIAHEINTPMGAINSMYDTMSRALAKLRDHEQLEGDATVEATFDVIDEANRVIADGTRRVADLVQSLRTFAHLDEAEYQLVDVNEGMASALTLLQMQEASGVDVVREFGPVEPLYCSAGRLNQVFMSILKNSCEAIDGDGGRVVINTCDEGSDLCVTVTDNGRGIAPQQLERIFDFDFASTASTTVKMGFGLATSYATVQEHGGQIHIDSTLGESTTVQIRLPRRQRRGGRDR